MTTQDQIDPKLIRLSSLKQDLVYMRNNLGASGMRRVLADLIDVLTAVPLGLLLHSFGHDYRFAVSYFLIRDCTPMMRSLGKTLTGVRIYRATDLSPATLTQLATRGLINIAVLIPLGILLSLFFAVIFSALFSVGVLIWIKGRDSVFLQILGYDAHTGRTVADRFANTHLITPLDLESLTRTEAKIQELHQELA